MQQVWLWKLAIFDQSRFISEMIGLYLLGTPTGTRMRPIEWCRGFQWLWMTPNLYFKVTPLFDPRYLRNGTLMLHNVLLTGVISNNSLEWLSEIFNDTKRRATSLRQLSFLLKVVRTRWRRRSSTTHREWVTATSMSPARYWTRRQTSFTPASLHPTISIILILILIISSSSSSSRVRRPLREMSDLNCQLTSTSLQSGWVTAELSSSNLRLARIFIIIVIIDIITICVCRVAHV